MGVDDKKDMEESTKMRTVLDAYPSDQAKTLAFHIGQCIDKIEHREKLLKNDKKRALMIICTGGEQSDDGVADLFVDFKSLPVFCIVRLCTPNRSVWDFWADIAKKNEGRFEIIRDTVTEAKTVQKLLPFLTYGEQLHKMR